MELCLPREVQTRPADSQAIVRHSRQPLDVDARLLRRTEFAAELLRVVLRPLKEVAADAREIAVDLLEVADRFDSVDRRAVTLVREPCAVYAVEPDHLLEAV